MGYLVLVIQIGYGLLGIWQWLLAVGYALWANGLCGFAFVNGYWLLALGYWLLAIGHWLLAIDYERPEATNFEKP